MTETAVIALVTLAWWWTAVSICAVIDWLRARKEPPQPPLVALPPDMQRDRPTVRQLARSPRLLARAVLECAIVGVVAFVFLPAAASEYVLHRRAEREASGT
jgi:hypothetical protein